MRSLNDWGDLVKCCLHLNHADFHFDLDRCFSTAPACPPRSLSCTSSFRTPTAPTAAPFRIPLWLLVGLVPAVVSNAHAG
jgi:hypothetical protein